MIKKRSSWRAKFISQEVLRWGLLYRRIYFKKLENEEGLIVKDSFYIDESESLKIIGPLSKGDLVSFDADEDLNNIEFYYPHGGKYGEEND